jgi:DNA mismatch repair protein MutL
MSKIRVLPDILASQVAAGEVVERPASVVKELVENSIDAGAREVVVEVDRGGSALIRVTDDGCGMSREDALLSLERHATSKLRTAADLSTIRTLGFRGEAVPSIASVSRFRMVTREAESVVGTEILVDGGKLRDVRDAGGAPGTVIEAKALFFNIPARRKFLRSESTESAHIEHQLRLHALAAPWVRFRLRRDGREVFDLPPAPDAGARVRHVLGPELGRELMALPLTKGPGVVVEGFVLPANHARKGRRHQFVFLNGRAVEDAVISRAVAEGFRGALADGLHPAAWLWIELDPILVDVNVHPAKREVRFHKPLDLRDVILEAVSAATRPPAPSSVRPLISQPALPVSAAHAEDVVPALLMPQSVNRAFVAHQPALPDWPASMPSAEVLASAPSEALKAKGHRPDFRILGLLHQRYVVLESTDGLVLFDPKAAHERILYEALRSNEGSASQALLVPVLLDFDPRDADTLLRHRADLAAAGLELESFGGNTIHIVSLPSAVPVEDPRAFLGGLLDELLHDPSAGKSFAADQLARLIAKRAAALVVPRLVETGDLLERLFRCDLPYCTADGRPTVTEYGLREIDRRFGVSRS